VVGTAAIHTADMIHIPLGDRFCFLNEQSESELISRSLAFVNKHQTS